MNSRIYTLLPIIAILCVLLIGCNSEEITEAAEITEATDRWASIRDELDSAYDQIPDIETFSGTEAEDFSRCFPEIESAVLYTKTGETNISADDPRLVRLVNSLAYSESEGLSWLMQGWIDEAQVLGRYDRGVPVLEVYFSPIPEERKDKTIATEKIVVVQNCYYSYYEGFRSSGGNRSIEQHWPYFGLLHDLSISNHEIMRDMDRYMDRQLNVGYKVRDPWLDLLVYAGF